jgi:hypothetical protein
VHECNSGPDRHRLVGDATFTRWALHAAPISFVAAAAFSVSIRGVSPNNPWSDPKAHPPELNLPMSMGPINLPNLPPVSNAKPKRRWRWLMVWTLLMFAGGVAAGPFLTDHAYVLVERVAPMLGMSAPHFVENHRRSPPPVQPMAPQVEAHSPAPTLTALPTPAPTPAPTRAAGEPKTRAAEARVEPTAAVAKPAAAAPEKKVNSKPSSAVPAVAQESPSAHRASVAAHGRTEVAATEAQAAHPQQTKRAVKAASSTDTPTRKSSGSEDPFASEDESAPNAAVPSGKPKPAPSEFSVSTKSQSAPKATARSNDSLDSLMADGVADSKAKKRESKDLDALLKDVQKSKPEPPPKREAPPPAASLSPADISRVMAGVKIRGNQCAQRLGQQGIAELKITVGRDGQVTDVHVGGKVADTPLAACVEKATRAATFPPSSGLRFDYRIDCR